MIIFSVHSPYKVLTITGYKKINLFAVGITANRLYSEEIYIVKNQTNPSSFHAHCTEYY